MTPPNECRSRKIVAVEIRPTSCAICKASGGAEELYPARLDSSAFTPETFSARRVPDRIHYRIVRCNSCGLVRSDPAATGDSLAALYAESGFHYEQETANLRTTYAHYLKKVIAHGAGRESLLEIGCGSGFFLEEAAAIGYSNVRGVEPSSAAVKRGPESIRSRIVQSMMHPDLFAADSFDVVCLFQILDHASDPNHLLSACWRVLRPGGFLLTINHNIEALSARLLGEKSPIIDVEHTFLYSPSTVGQLLTANRFAMLQVGPVFNRFSVAYLLQLAPFGPSLRRVRDSLREGAFGRTCLTLPIGNLYAIARKSDSEKQRENSPRSTAPLKELNGHEGGRREAEGRDLHDRIMAES